MLYTGVNIPRKATSTRSVADLVALQAALKPIQGVEFDLYDASIEQAPELAAAELSTVPMSATSHSGQPESSENEYIDSTATSTKLVRKYPNLIFPSGALKRKSHSVVYTNLFKMAWSGEEDKARTLMTRLRKSREVSIDLKIVSMEVVHTVNADRDLKSVLWPTQTGESVRTD